MWRVTATTAALVCWLSLVVLNLHGVEGRMLPSGVARFVTQDLQVHCEGCVDKTGAAGSSTHKTAEFDNREDVAHYVTQDLQVHCEGCLDKAGALTYQTAKVFEPCKYTWQLPGTDCP